MRPVRQAIGYVEGDVSSETALWAKPPRRLEGANVGLYIPREQLAGRLLLSPHRTVLMGISYEAGFPGGAVPISPGLIQRPDLSIGGTGLYFGMNFKISPKLTFGFSCDAWSYTISSRVAYHVANTDDGCEGLPDPRTWPQMHKYTWIFVGRAQAGLGVDLGWSHLSFGGGVRNQPHNVDESKELHISLAFISARIDSVAYPFAYINWEVRLAPWAYAGITMYQPLNFDPIIYAPIIGITLRLTHVARERTDWVGPPPEPVPITPFTF